MSTPVTWTSLRLVLVMGNLMSVEYLIIFEDVVEHLLNMYFYGVVLSS